MRLSKVTLFGFKSFADKTTFDFAKGITAVLGPNGCGKSNVVDAVKWVLGEQSAKNLRGSEMADVIFAGSEHRKPMGMAEVTLTFDNHDGLLPTDYNEVAVTRRLYRSGESEYYLNKNRCRLRDVKDLFLDTGIGTKAYSYIEQGKVEALLAAKPHDRRAVFEEAAGISKYKVRRKESLSRLERTEQYLQRVNDIVEEVEKRIRSVSRQAQSARRYQRLSGELTSTRGLLYTVRWQTENAKRDDILGKLEEVQELQRQEENSGGLLGGVIAELQQKELAIEEKLANSDKRMMEVQQEFSTLEAEKARSQERVLSLEREAASATDQAGQLRNRMGNIDSEKESLRREREAMDSQIAALGAEITTREEGGKSSLTRIQELEQEQEGCRTRLLELQNERNQITATKARLESELSSLRAQIQELQDRKGNLNERKATIGNRVDQLTRTYEEAQAEELRHRKSLEDTKGGVDKSREQGERAAALLNELEKQRSSSESRLRTLRELESSMAGFFHGVRAVMEGWRKGNRDCADIEGLVADLITAKGDVAIAIETALGASQQNIITNTAYGARNCISFLKRERAGRATFLPLDRMKSRDALSDRLVNLPGVVGEAFDLVEFDNKYQPVAEHLLGGILIVETLDRALELQKGDGSRVRMVTLDGDVVNPSGAITGGKEKHQKGGLVTRKSEMEELEREIQSLSTKVEEAQADRDAALAQLLRFNQSIREVEERVTAAQAAAGAAKSELSGVEAELRAFQSEADGFARQEEQLKEKLEVAEHNRSEVEANTGSFEETERELQARILELSPLLHQARQAAEATKDELTTVKVRLAEQTQKRQDSIARLESLEQNALERNEQASGLEKRAQEAAQEAIQLQTALAEIETKLQAIIGQRSEAEGASGSLRQDLGNIRSELEARRNEDRAVAKRMADIQNSLSSLKVSERECVLRIEAVQERAQEDLGISDLEAFAQEMQRKLEAMENGEEPVDEDLEDEESDDIYSLDPELAKDPAALESRVHDLQEKIRRIGPVNHQAIEELAELKARRDFLVSQQEDLDSARDDLQALLDRLNIECRKRFDQTFTTVRENFQVMFRRLFGGGKADLVLEETDDPLNAGIDIIARPPGKEPKSISLLSGGEKALCAVALLFSIFRSKPSPFCILDEVDGPLDESNIDRFMETVKDYSQDSQFIIITHSKRTMSMVDLIYGVTQSEPGVSRKMSLKFHKGGDEEEIEEVA
ncbi:MAG: chromosome segregation protein SMC [Planctomycetota bacterium]|jgi:chromosome segregation protein